ncbi:Gag, partial [Moniliophthora roreri MCA 2997]
MLKHWLKTQIPADKMMKANTPIQEEVLTLLNWRFDPLSLFYMPWREEDEEGDGQVCLSDEGNRQTRKGKPVAEETPLTTNGVPQSALDSLTKQMRQLQLNQTSILNTLSSMGTSAPQQSNHTYNRTKTCFICGVQNPPHPLHSTKCLEGQFVMMNGSDLPWTPYSGYQEGIAAYICELHNSRSTTQASQSGFMWDSPPHQQASVNHYGLFCDGSPVFSEEGFNFNGEQFSSNPVLCGRKDTRVCFDPLARPDMKPEDSKAKKSMSDCLPKPSTRPDITSPPKPDITINIPALPLPINRKDGWKDSVPSASSKPKPDITMKDDNKEQLKYHFTSDLQKKSDPTTVYNAVMNQPIMVPIYQLIRNSPALQKLIADGTHMRREYVTKQAEYSLSNSISSSKFDKMNVTEVMMMMVDAKGITCHYRAVDLNVGDVESVYEFLGRCTNALLKSPKVSKLFAMVTGILELMINGVMLLAMINTGSELSVGSQDLPDKTNCTVDFGSCNWSLKGIHRQPEPLQGVMVEAMMKIGGQDFPHHIFISHQNMDKQDIILDMLNFISGRIQKTKSNLLFLFPSPIPKTCTLR